jgi:hypothetical protein
VRRSAPPDVAARSAAQLEVKSRQVKSNQVTPSQVKSPDVAARSAAPLELQPASCVSNGERDHNRLGHLLARRFGARAGARRVALGQGDCPHLWGRDQGRRGEHLHAGRACCPHPRKATVHTSAESASNCSAAVARTRTPRGPAEAGDQGGISVWMCECVMPSEVHCSSVLKAGDQGGRSV